MRNVVKVLVLILIMNVFLRDTKGARRNRTTTKRTRTRTSGLAFNGTVTNTSVPSHTTIVLEGGKVLEQTQFFNPNTRELSVSVPAHGDREAVTIIYGEKEMVTAHDDYCLVGEPPRDLDKSVYENSTPLTPLNHDKSDPVFILNIVDQDEMTDNEKESLPESFKTLCKNKALWRTNQVTVNETIFQQKDDISKTLLYLGGSRGTRSLGSNSRLSRQKRSAGPIQTTCLRTGKCCDFTFRTPDNRDVRYISATHNQQVTIICTACSSRGGSGLCKCKDIKNRQSFHKCSKDSNTCTTLEGQGGWPCKAKNKFGCIPLTRQCKKGGKRTCWQNFKICGNQCCPPEKIQGCKGCITEKGEQCIFPFIYDGVSYDKCTTKWADNGKPWCATKTDDKGEAIWGKWGDCNLKLCNL